jgi:hypothetical protein
MKTNPLLVNMKNKIAIIDGSISMIYQLQKGETIKFGEHVEGALKYSVTTKEEHRASLNETLIKLFNERENLQKRVNNF